MSAAAAAAACGRPSYSRADFGVAQASVVGLFPAADYDVDLADVMWRGLQVLRPPVRGRRVLLKPNLVEYDARHNVINTNPAVVIAAADAFLRAGAAEVVVAEGPGHRRDIEYLLGASGLGDRLAEAKIPFTDLNHDDVRMVGLRTRFMGLTEIALPVEVLNSDFLVSMPKLKTHHWAGITCSMKNLFGVVPGAVYGWPKNVLHYHGIDNAIVDLAATVRPAFSIVDAVVGMEGDGPIMGKPRPLGFIAMGSDPVAVDATCARIVGFDPARIPYLAAAATFLGNTAEETIDQRGEPPSRYAVKFDVIPSLRYLLSR